MREWIGVWGGTEQELCASVEGDEGAKGLVGYGCGFTMTQREGHTVMMEWIGVWGGAQQRAS